MAGDWSTMHLDLLVAIAMKLENCEDFIYFSLVCRWWNRAASSIKNDWRAIPTPWLLLAESNKENPKCLRKIFNLKDNKCYKFTLPETFGTRCSGSAYGWVAMIDRSLNVKLFNPVSKAHIPIPSLENEPDLEGGYNPKFHKTKDEYITWCLGGFVQKMVVLKASQSGRHEFVIVAFCVSGIVVARHGDQSWTSIPTGQANYPMVDVVVMDALVFALYYNGKLVCWNAKEFSNLEFEKQIDYILGDELDYTLNKAYLVQSGIELIMVIRYKDEVLDETEKDYDYDIRYQTYSFKVFKLDPRENLWEEIAELCDVALLLGCNSSMSVSSSNYLKESSIYFTDDETELWDAPKEFGAHDMGVFEIKTGQISRFYDGDDMRSFFCPPTLFIPQL